jgi:Reverse transcriptase (RNA-dependent DNA polymerase)
MIGPNQNVFLKGRFILDGVVAAQEILHHSHYTKESGLLVKLDFEKAFDKLNWEYLLESFTQRDFSTQWVSWIHQILNEGKVCINFNGTLTEYFEYTRGVRQGDPLSHLLFVFAAEGLSKLINRGVTAGLIQGLGPTLSNGSQVSHLQYVDATLLLVKPSSTIFNTLK